MFWFWQNHGSFSLIYVLISWVDSKVAFYYFGCWKLLLSGIPANNILAVCGCQYHFSRVSMKGTMFVTLLIWTTDMPVFHLHYMEDRAIGHLQKMAMTEDFWYNSGGANKNTAFMERATGIGMVCWMTFIGWSQDRLPWRLVFSDFIKTDCGKSSRRMRDVLEESMGTVDKAESLEGGFGRYFEVRLVI